MAGDSGSLAEEGPADPSAQGEWVVSVQQEHGPNPLRRLLGGDDPSTANLVGEAVRSALDGAADITVSLE
jgi:hypothetical protein